MSPETDRLDFTGFLETIQTVPTFHSAGTVTKLVGIGLEAVLPDPIQGQLVEVDRDGDTPLPCEVVGFDTGRVFLLPFGKLHGVRPGASVRTVATGHRINAGDFLIGRVVDGLGNVIHERLFAAEIRDVEDPRLVEAGILGNFTPAEPPKQLPSVATIPEATTWLNQHALTPFLNEVREERLSEVDRIAAHIELSLTELIQKADEEIGRAAAEAEKKVVGAEGRLAQAETRHSELMERREKRR